MLSCVSLRQHIQSVLEQTAGGDNACGLHVPRCAAAEVEHHKPTLNIHTTVQYITAQYDEVQ